MTLRSDGSRTKRLRGWAARQPRWRLATALALAVFGSGVSGWALISAVKPSVQRKRPTREELATLLSRHGGDVAQLAREIGRQRTLVWRWLRESQLKPDDFR